MKCLHPLSLDVGLVSCGKCINCIVSKRTDWTVRLGKELLTSDSHVFCTLTYDDAHVPLDEHGNYHPEKRDVQLFLKKLRHHAKVRYFVVSEFGDNYNRIHYHMLLFGFPYVFDQSAEFLTEIWEKGFVQCKPLEPGHITYVVNYIYPNPNTPNPPGTSGHNFMLMSRRPGIGSLWLSDSVKDDYRRNPRLTSLLGKNGKKVRLPRYFRDKIYDDSMKRDLADGVALVNSAALARMLSLPLPSGLEDIQKTQAILERERLALIRTMPKYKYSNGKTW